MLNMKIILLLLLFSFGITNIISYNNIKNKELTSNIIAINDNKIISPIKSDKKEVIELEPIKVIASKDSEENESSIKEELLKTENEKLDSNNKLTISEENLKKERFSFDKITKEQKKLIIERMLIEHQAGIDANILAYNELPLFSPGFFYEKYDVRESKDKNYDFDILIKLKSYDIKDDLDNAYVKLASKYLKSEKMNEEELKNLKIFYGLFVCSKKTNYEIMKDLNENLKVKTIYILENLKKEQDEVYYSINECDNINQKLIELGKN